MVSMCVYSSLPCCQRSRISTDLDDSSLYRQLFVGSSRSQSMEPGSSRVVFDCWPIWDTEAPDVSC